MAETITVAGEKFTVPVRFQAGDTITLTEGQAAQFNQTYHENLRNNFASKVKKAKEAGAFDVAAFQAQLDQYAQSYEFGVRAAGTGGGTRAPRDPVAAEALNIASETIRNKLKAAGKDMKQYPAKVIREAAIKLVDKDPTYRKLAEQRIAENQAVASESLDDLLSGISPVVSSAPTEQAAA